MSEQEVSVEDKARQLGWAPKEEFRGDPERWVDAETFVHRGEEIMPILKSQNGKLHETVKQLEGRLGDTSRALREAQESIEALREVHEEDTKRKVEAAKLALREELRAARTEGDVDREMEVMDKINELNQPPPKKEPPTAKEPTETPAFRAFKEKYPQFASDVKWQAMALAFGQEIRTETLNAGKQISEADFYEQVAHRTAEFFNPPQRRGDKMEGGSSGASSAGSTNKTYSDLPAEAREACDRQENRLVGERKPFKDRQAWRKYFTDMYFQMG